MFGGWLDWLGCSKAHGGDALESIADFVINHVNSLK
jgi:hypothetical protein